jgi:hypothetical protein
MDAKDAVPILLTLPVEILDVITSMVPCKSIGRFLLVGNKLMTQKLLSFGAVTTLNYVPRPGLHQIYHWEPILSKFQHVKHLTIIPPGYGGRLENFKLSQLPPTLTTLRIDTRRAHRLFAPNMTPLQLDQLFPSLVSLSARLKFIPKHTIDSPILPQSLTHLAIQSWSSKIALPDNLQRLSIKRLLVDENETHIPSCLTRLTISDTIEGKAQIFFLLLPPCMERIDVSYSSSKTSYTDIAILPRGLKSLEARSIKNQTLLSASVDLELPPGLTTLQLPMLYPLSLWSQLPKTLTSLRWASPDSDLEVDVVSKLPDAFAMLPSGLKTFQLPLPSGNRGVFWVEPLHLPAGLETLELDWAILSRAAAESLPSGLKALQLQKLGLDVFKVLPKSLTEITTSIMDFCVELLLHLPPNLTSLKSRLPYDYDSESSLPGDQSVWESELQKFQRHWKALEKPFRFPPGFKKFDFDRCAYIGDEIISSVGPSAAFVSAASALFITDSGIEAMARLARSLTTLDFGSSDQITGECFKFLPQTLRFLELASSTEIYDHQIAYLPRELLYIYFMKAIKLTNASLKLFPRVVQTLRLDNNGLIDRSSIDDWPLPLKHGGGGTFYCVSFTSINGKIV